MGGRKYYNEYFREKNVLKICSCPAKVLNLHPYSRGRLDTNICLGYGVIGNTTDSGPVFPGSSPGTPTEDSTKRNIFLRAVVFEGIEGGLRKEEELWDVSFRRFSPYLSKEPIGFRHA